MLNGVIAVYYKLRTFSRAYSGGGGTAIVVCEIVAHKSSAVCEMISRRDTPCRSGQRVFPEKQCMIRRLRSSRAAGHDDFLRRNGQIDCRGKLHFIRKLHPVRRIVVHGVAEARDLGACNLDRCRQTCAERDSRDIEIAGWIVIHVAGRSNSIERKAVAGGESGRGVACAVGGRVPVRWRKPVQIPASARPVPSRRIRARRRKRNYRGEEKTKCFPPPPPGLCQLCFS